MDTEGLARCICGNMRGVAERLCSSCFEQAKRWEAQLNSAKVNVAKLGFDSVERPEHYTASSIEVFDAIEAWELNYCRGQVVKYVARAGKKAKETELEDLKKARWYLNKEIDRLGGTR